MKKKIMTKRIESEQQATSLKRIILPINCMKEIREVATEVY